MKRSHNSLQLEQMYLMLDDNYLVIIKPDVSNPLLIKGHVDLKQKFKQVVETMID